MLFLCEVQVCFWQKSSVECRRTLPQGEKIRKMNVPLTEQKIIPFFVCASETGGDSRFQRNMESTTWMK
jgi:hypothetical protein